MIFTADCGCKYEVSTETTTFKQRLISVCLTHYTLAVVDYTVDNAFSDIEAKLSELEALAAKVAKQRP